MNLNKYIERFAATHLPEVINFAVNKWLVLPFYDIEVLDITGIQILFYHKAKETIVWSVSWKQNKNSPYHQCSGIKKEMFCSWDVPTDIFFL